MHYNTTHENPKVKVKYQYKATTQEDKVLKIYQDQANQRNRPLISASEVWRIFPDTRTPLTSIRRAISDLCKAGTLEKTEFKVTGYYGRPEYCYQLTQQDSRAGNQCGI